LGGEGNVGPGKITDSARLTTTQTQIVDFVREAWVGTACDPENSGAGMPRGERTTNGS